MIVSIEKIKHKIPSRGAALRNAIKKVLNRFEFLRSLNTQKTRQTRRIENDFKFDA